MQTHVTHHIPLPAAAAELASMGLESRYDLIAYVDGPHVFLQLSRNAESVNFTAQEAVIAIKTLRVWALGAPGEGARIKGDRIMDVPGRDAAALADVLVAAIGDARTALDG